MTNYDIVIVGGGLVGQALACALSNRPLRIAMIEAQLSSTTVPKPFDTRSIALSYGSKKIFEGLSLWENISGHATPIQFVHVSEQGKMGFSRIVASEYDLPALGYVVEAHALSKQLTQALSERSNVEWLCPAEVEHITIGEQSQLEIVHLGGKRQLSAKLLVGADGANSIVRHHCGLETVSKSFEQHAVICNISTSISHGGKAFERFTKQGPLAILPLKDSLASVIWSVSSDEVTELLAYDDTDFLTQLQKAFGFRLGKLLAVGKRNAFPLHAMMTPQQAYKSAVLIGNAAHTVHPLAGQGFNLGLRDVATLADTVVNAIDGDVLSITPNLLSAYAESRKTDQQHVVRFTEGLLSLFAAENRLFQWGRNWGLVGHDLWPFAKRTLSQRNMGLAGRLPRLARGLSIE